MNIRTLIGFNGSYYNINREERNLTAIFYHLLLQKDNLKTFLKSLTIDFPVIEDEVAIYFEYAFLRDLWNSIDKSDNDTKRRIILSLLKPLNISYLATCSIEEFNTYFGAVPMPSTKFIQSPGNWSIDNYKLNIAENSEFLKVCKFKWCFNAKPDIVIHTSNNHAICIEGKFESNEGLYPTKTSEKQEFGRRNLSPVKQTEIQKRIMELLGIQSSFIILAQKQIPSSTHMTLLWEDVFKDLDITSSPAFIKRWVTNILRAKNVNATPQFRDQTNSTINRKNHIAPEYSNRVDKFKNTFITAYNFLQYPVKFPTPIYLKTSVNAHLYFKDYYLSYIIIGHDEITFRAKFNNMIAAGTTDESNLLFDGPIQKIIDSLYGIKEGWAINLGDKIVIHNSAPEAFFSALIAYIEGLS